MSKCFPYESWWKYRQDRVVEVFQDVLDKLSDVGEKGQAIEIL
jgi:hypothetical protein